MLFCVRIDMGGHKIKKNILKGPINTILYINEICLIVIAIAAMEWNWCNRN